MKRDGTWDVRCPGELIKLRVKLMGEGKRPKPNYFLVDRKTAAVVLRILSRAYRVKSCRVAKVGPAKGKVGYEPTPEGGRPMVWLPARPHLKAVFNAFYLHLGATNEEYNADLSWSFADRLWVVLTTAPLEAQSFKFRVRKDRVSVFILYQGRRLRPAMVHSRLYYPGAIVHAQVQPAGTGLIATVHPWHLRQLPTERGDTWATGKPTKVDTSPVNGNGQQKFARLERFFTTLKSFYERAKAATPADGPAIRQEMSRLLVTSQSFGPLPGELMNALNRMTKKAQHLAKHAGRRKPRVAPAPKPVKNGAPTAKTQAPTAAWRQTALKDTDKVVATTDNPYRGGRASKWKYPKVGTPAVVADLVERGMKRADIKWDISKGYVKVVRP